VDYASLVASLPKLRQLEILEAGGSSPVCRLGCGRLLANIGPSMETTNASEWTHPTVMHHVKCANETATMRKPAATSPIEVPDRAT
jgi:hypothetical protein